MELISTQEPILLHPMVLFSHRPLRLKFLIKLEFSLCCVGENNFHDKLAP